MANKYIRHGATYCGDGTTSDAAASNGAAGAWNDINVFEGSAPAYGTAPAAGDVVFIRSKSEAGADITRTVGANINLGSATGSGTTAQITWVLDDGAVWSGVSGVLTYEVTSGNYSITFRAWNTFDVRAEDALTLKVSYANYYANFCNIGLGAVVKNVRWNLAAVTLTSNGPSGAKFSGNSQSGHTHLINPRMDIGNALYSAAIEVGGYCYATVTNPRINLSAAITGSPMFLLSGNGAKCNIVGGSISGSTSGAKLCGITDATNNGVYFNGTQIPANMNYRTADPTTALGDNRVEGIGCDGGIGSFSSRNGGVIDSRQDGNYPTLNGAYPNSTSTGWSWKVYPSNASRFQLLDIPSLKLYTDTAATKTLTVEMLVATAFLSLAHKGNVWLEVSYIDDSTGATKYVSSCDFGSTAALDSSSAAWSATTYGATSLTKKKIALTTPTSIKKDTVITATLRVAAKSVSATDILFIDPDPQLT